MTTILAGAAVAAGLWGPARAVDVAPHIDSARTYLQKGDTARAAHELEVALFELQDRLGRTLSALMPAPLPGWAAEEAEYEGLGSSGGGLSVTRAYTKEDASLNASILLDNPAVEEALQQPASATTKKIKVGMEDAMLRWDAGAHSGDVNIVLGKRILLQIEGDGLASGDVLTDLAKGFDIPAIRKAIGIN